MNHDPILAPAHSTQWPQLAALLSEYALPLDGLTDHLGTTVVALDGPTVVGCAAVELYGDAGLLRSVAVAPAWQGHGVGSRLVDAGLELARSHGVRRLYLLTETAVDYFVRRGFVPVARTDVAPAVSASVEFTTACPTSAQAMYLALEAALAPVAPPATQSSASVPA